MEQSSNTAVTQLVQESTLGEQLLLPIELQLPNMNAMVTDIAAQVKNATCLAS